MHFLFSVRMSKIWVKSDCSYETLDDQAIYRNMLTQGGGGAWGHLDNSKQQQQQQYFIRVLLMFYYVQ